jgi:hypothetical protein
MESVSAGALINDRAFQDLPTPSGNSQNATERPNERLQNRLSAQNSLAPVELQDKVEISGGSLIYRASQELSYQKSSLVVRSDGTYAYRQTTLEARQDIAIALSFNSGSANSIDLDAVTAQLEGIVEDMQQGFRDSLQGLVQSLRGQQPGSAASSQAVDLSPANQAWENFLSEDDKALIHEYLTLIKQLAGDDSRVTKVVNRLEAMLEMGQQTAQAQDANFTFQAQRVDFSYQRVEVSFGQNQEQVQEGEPLVLDLDGDGVELRSMEDGVRFDIDNDGQKEQTGFVTGDDALLALDKNNNGRIDGVAELFGDRTGARNGFEDLSRYDMNQDERIDAQDPVFTRLRLFQDKNGDGRSSYGELRALNTEGIESLSLNAKVNPSVVAGNRIAETAAFTRANGSRGTIAETYFRYKDI